MVTFGGEGNVVPHRNDIWELSLSTLTWHETFPNSCSSLSIDPGTVWISFLVLSMGGVIVLYRIYLSHMRSGYQAI